MAARQTEMRKPSVRMLVQKSTPRMRKHQAGLNRAVLVQVQAAAEKTAKQARAEPIQPRSPQQPEALAARNRSVFPRQNSATGRTTTAME